ncbi:MAG TPA: branched-chain amino acid ABC transporter permease [Candidatus Methanomethylia archaeon]|nr:branched-chain amino acid ABC transporter permease [Candidatus Methanomethylicia archaeon]
MIPGIADPIRFILDFAVLFAVYSILSISLNLEYGYTGIPNFGKVLFFAGGAFVVGSLTARLAMPLAGISFNPEKFCTENVKLTYMVSQFFAANPHIAIALFLLLILLAVGVSALLGYLASYPAIRLREDYLGITLLAAGELVRIIARNYEPIVCGTLGISVPNPFAWLSGRTQDLMYIAVMFTAAIGIWIYTERLSRSPYGRMLRALRDNELAAEALGKCGVSIRMQTLVLGSAMAGLAGALYAYYTGAVYADDYVPIRTFLVWVMVIIGGAGNNSGAALGALIYVFMDRMIGQYKYYVPVPFDINYLSYIILGVVLIAMLMYRPGGILPEKPSKTIDFEKIAARFRKNLSAREA